MAISEALRERLNESIEAIPLIDTHEHVPNERIAVEGEPSFFSFFEHYVSSDLVSAGMPREALEQMRDGANGLSLEERWALMAPYWPYAKTTGYGRAMLGYMAALFGVDDINEHTYLTLCARIRESRKPGWYQKVLREKGNIETCLVITWPGQAVEVDQPFFRAVPILDHYAIVSTRDELQALEQEAGCAIQTLDQLEAARDAKLDEFIGQGIAAVKIFLAYRRPLLFEKVDKAAAARVFDRVWLSQSQDLSFEDLKPLQDYMTRTLVGLAADRGLPIQIHTGLQEGNGNVLNNSNPVHLTNLIMDYPDARFDLFHAGYPYTGELTALAKYFPNVCANLCWVPAISPSVYVRTLHEWIETIPANKIFAVGGDSNYVEGAYGHCMLARKLVGQALAEKVEAGYLSEDEALWYAGRVLRENALEFLRL